MSRQWSVLEKQCRVLADGAAVGVVLQMRGKSPAWDTGTIAMSVADQTQRDSYDRAGSTVKCGGFTFE